MLSVKPRIELGLAGCGGELRVCGGLFFWSLVRLEFGDLALLNRDLLQDGTNLVVDFRHIGREFRDDLGLELDNFGLLTIPLALKIAPLGRVFLDALLFFLCDRLELGFLAVELFAFLGFLTDYFLLVGRVLLQFFELLFDWLECRVSHRFLRIIKGL
jgi:hypothetical protein